MRNLNKNPLFAIISLCFSLQDVRCDSSPNQLVVEYTLQSNDESGSNLLGANVSVVGVLVAPEELPNFRQLEANRFFRIPEHGEIKVSLNAKRTILAIGASDGQNIFGPFNLYSVDHETHQKVNVDFYSHRSTLIFNTKGVSKYLKKTFSNEILNRKKYNISLEASNTKIEGLIFHSESRVDNAFSFFEFPTNFWPPGIYKFTLKIRPTTNFNGAHNVSFTLLGEVHFMNVKDKHVIILDDETERSEGNSFPHDDKLRLLK